MLEFVEGKVGSGKSFYAVKRALAAMALGKMVVTNITLSPENCLRVLRDRFKKRYKELPYRFIDEDDIPRLHECVPYGDGSESVCLAIVDEAQNFFSSRDWAKLDSSLRRWLTQSRKFGTDVIMITQHSANVDTQFRRQASYIWGVRNMSSVKLPLLGPIPYCMLVQRDWQPGIVHGYRLVKYEQWVFDCYESTAFLDQETLDLAERAARVDPALFEEEDKELKPSHLLAFVRGLFRVLAPGTRRRREGASVETKTEGGEGENL